MSDIKRIVSPYGICRDLGSGVSGFYVRAGESDAAAHTTTFVASTATPDRAMDVVSQDGWDLSNFDPTGPICDNHDAFRVCGAGTAEVVEGKLMVTAHWDHENPDPSIRSVGWQHEKQFRRAGSVGFLAGQKTRRSALDRDHPHFQADVELDMPWGKVKASGFYFENNTLVEFSSATVPMNPEAVQRSRAPAFGLRDLIARSTDEDREAAIAWLKSLGFEPVAKTSNHDDEFAIALARALRTIK